MLQLRNKLKSKKGFTLIELIVVVAILAILAVIAVPRFMGSLDDAQKAADEANARTIESAASLYYAENGNWPADLATLASSEYLDEVPSFEWDDGWTETSFADAYDSGTGTITLTEKQ